MTATLIKCQVKKCSRDQYPNQLTSIEIADKEYWICPACAKELDGMLSDKRYLGTLYKGFAMSLGEIMRMRLENGLTYARNDFDFRRI